ncbi:protein RRP6-like 2 [Curcuma longa]|uniref:protein RRP6-like 2 n=1 Tax=Curcuma longa TaxID=136217 RepID=UPI003D9E81A3
MNEEPTSTSPLKDEADSLRVVVSEPLAYSESKASARSRIIPSGEDLRFFNNTGGFKFPLKEIGEAESSSRGMDNIFGIKKPPRFPEDLDDASDSPVVLNVEFRGRLVISMDEFKKSREEKEAEGAKDAAMGLKLEGEFKSVDRMKMVNNSERNAEKHETVSASGSSVNVAMLDKRTKAVPPKVPFHIPTIRRPQDEYNIRVNNKNEPFRHVCLDTGDGNLIHPLVKLSVVDFVDRKSGSEPVEPLHLESTPFKLVETQDDLRMVAAKLQDVDEFAVDLEHNQYRSFLGLTCLMQISTRDEDFVIDTLKLRIYVGQYLREVFKDHSKRKVMHGADRDILWLQRDFSIYVCNLFDTGQASRVLQMERNSLEYLLHHFCGVEANKDYQNADWRLRPIPDEMLKYAREDTHYLLYIYDHMKRTLLAESSDANDLILEVYKRSSTICMQLYKKEIFTDTSFLSIYGLRDADLNAMQLAVASGLYQWRDYIARVEDESTGYILPNKTLIQIAKQLPRSPEALRLLVKFTRPSVEKHMHSIIGIINSSIIHSSTFEAIAQQLKEERIEAVSHKLSGY